MSALHPTPPERLLDRQGRPHFLWDLDMTQDRLRHLLRVGTRDQRAWLLGKVMRQAKPDDVFAFATLADVVSLWPDLRRYLGRSRDFWAWCLSAWEALPRD